MLKQSKNMKPKTPMPQALALSLFGLIALSLPAYSDQDDNNAQPQSNSSNVIYGNTGANTIYNPTFPGTQYCLPGTAPVQGAPPPPGSGYVPIPVTSGTNYLPPAYGANYLTSGYGTNCVPPNYGTNCVPQNQQNTYTPPIIVPGSNYPVYTNGAGTRPGLSLGNIIYAGAGTTGLRTPLVPGANFSLPYLPSAQGAPPPLGSGFVPFPVNPGMYFLPPTTIPWTNGTAGNAYSQPTNSSIAPANQIDLQSNQISLPVSNYSALPPGALNSQVRGSIPHGPSTPGADPGQLRPPSFNNGSAGASSSQNHDSAGVLTNVDQNGQLPDLLKGVRANQRDARQHSADYGLKRTASGYRLKGQSWDPQKGSKVTDFGMGVNALQAKGLAGSKMPPQTSFDAPRAGNPGNRKANFAGAQQTSDLDGIPMVNPQKIKTNPGGTVALGPPDPPQTTKVDQ